MATEDIRLVSEDEPVEPNSNPALGADETPDPLVTDPTDTVTDPDDDDEEDALEQYYRARRDREKLDEASEDERINARVEAALRQRHAQERDTTEKDQLNSVYRETVGNIINGLRSRKFYDAEGYEVVMADSDIQTYVLNHVNSMNAKQRSIIGEALSDKLAEEALARLPADYRDKFSDEVSGKDIGDWLVAFAEYMAPKTKFAAKVEADKDVAVKAAEARGKAKGQRMPPGSPPEGVEREAKPSVEYNFKSSFDRALALKNKDISEAEFRAMERKARAGL